MKPIGKYRWTICGLVFFATTINYLDRSVISLLKPFLEQEFLWTETDYAHIVISFQVAYALGMIGAGRFIDKLGTKKGYALAISIWSVGAIVHAFSIPIGVKISGLLQWTVNHGFNASWWVGIAGFSVSVLGFMFSRAVLAFGEAGNFPAAIKTTAEWFPKKERAFATGFFNSGTNIGAVAAPLTVPWIAAHMGWQWAFIITGAIGLIWLILWLIIYEIPSKHSRLSKEEYIYIHSDVVDTGTTTVQPIDKEERVSWVALLGFKQTWAFVLGKFLTDPVWWFYLFWLPAFLKAQYNIEGTGVTWPIFLVYFMAGFGSIWGGWLPIYFIKKGWALFRARKTSMLIFSLCVIPVVFAQWLGSINMWFAVLIIGVAASAHQAWSANIFTTASDMFPKRIVASVTGLGGMAGAVGGILIAWLAGSLFEHYKSLGTIEIGYYIMFFICGGAYLVAWLIMHLLTPTMKQVDV